MNELRCAFTIACDLKISNLLLGLMSHSFMHPCSWCDVNKKQLHLRGNTRTMHSLHASFTEFSASNAPQSAAKEFGNVVRPCLLRRAPGSTAVVDIVPPPELHLLTGIMNTMYAALKEEWPECERWLAACHVVREAMNGGCFTGNSCKMLLHNVDLLA